jgi:DNA mismatch endonuclease (patch repair protein)
MTRAIPAPPTEAVRERMRRTRRRDTPAELALRSELHRAGLRFRVDAPVAGLRRRPDIVFTKARIAVFVDGCFWHSCPIHGTRPKRNAEWWAEKLDGNVARDEETNRRLTEQGWAVIRVWEHEDPHEAAERIVNAWTDRRREARDGHP